MGELSGERNGSRGSFKRLARREVTALSLAGLVMLAATAVALAVTGDLTQPAGTAGCISETGAGPCADGHALDGAVSVAVSPDGKSAYVASTGDTVARFHRDPTTGWIAQPAGTGGCISETGAGTCADGHALSGALAVAVSPDGKSVYVASASSNAVVRLNRNTITGAITQPAGVAGCVSQTGAGPCADGHALSGARSVAVSPDGKSVYVASRASNAVARFNRDTSTGAITQPAGTGGCISETGAGTCADGHGLSGAFSVAITPDGKSVYVGSFSSNAVARLNRGATAGGITQPAGTAGCVSETGAGPCADGHWLGLANGVAVSPDGKSVYLTASGNFPSGVVVRFNRTTTAGAITQPAGTAGCVSETGAGTCADGHGLSGASSAAVSPDGKSVYVASLSSNAVARLDRDTTTLDLTQPAGTAGCVSETGAGTCADGHGLSGGPRGVAVSPDGNSVYVAANVAVARFNRAP
jgi:DNA-binding beta-propeller fold protein YncE